MYLLIASILIFSTPSASVIEAADQPKMPKEELFLSDGNTVTVDAINFISSQDIPTSELQSLTEPFLYQALNQNNLSQLKSQVRTYLAQKGFTDIRVSIPPIKSSQVHTLDVIIVAKPPSGKH